MKVNRKLSLPHLFQPDVQDLKNVRNVYAAMSNTNFICTTGIIKKGIQHNLATQKENDKFVDNKQPKPQGYSIYSYP